MKYFAIDVLAVLVFAILARAAHGGLEIAHILDTWWPFTIGTILGWALQRGKNPLTLSYGITVWICTAVAGLTFWALRHGAIPHWSFIIVAVMMAGILILGWRSIVTLISRLKNISKKY